jgi:hypothetical protein
VRRLTGIAITMTVAGVVAAGASACGGSTTPKNPSGPAALQHPKSLVGLVGHNDAFSISLSDEAGNAITNLAAGTYSITIKDESTIHDFHLRGAGLDKVTGIGSTSTTTFSATFKPGSYSFLCDPHASSMHGAFTVT